MNEHLSNPEPYDVLILGSGEGGKYLAWSLSSSGRSTALIERRYIGGSCPNIACLPSKNIIHSAKVAHLLTDAGAYGLPRPTGAVDMKVVRQRKRDMVGDLVQTHEERFRKSGVTLVRGEGRFMGPKTIAVTGPDGIRVLTGETVIISTGSRATIDGVPGLREAQPLTHIEALELDRLPSHVIVLGGGYVGLEFAQTVRRFGSRVTVLERGPRLLAREDEDVAGALTRILVAEGVEVITGVQVERIEGRSGEHVTLHLRHRGSPVTLDGSHLLAATGRAPNTAGLGLEKAGVALTERGLRTSQRCTRNHRSRSFRRRRLRRQSAVHSHCFR